MLQNPKRFQEEELRVFKEKNNLKRDAVIQIHGYGISLFYLDW